MPVSRLFFVVVCFGVSALATNALSTVQLTTPCGPVRGSIDQAIYAFRGIPFNGQRLSVGERRIDRLFSDKHWSVSRMCHVFHCA